MNKLMMKVAGVVVALTLFAVLSVVGYFAQVGFSQSFGPSDPGAAGNMPRKRPNRGNVAPSNSYGEDDPRPEPIPEGESVWEDYDPKDLDNETRLPDRPGNFEVVTQVAHFLREQYAIEPSYPDLAFPFWDEGKKFETEEAWSKAWEEREANDRARGRHRKNKLRQFNLELALIRFVNIPAGSAEIPNFADYGLSQRKYDQFVEIRKIHSERCVMVAIAADLESLQSDKVEAVSPDNPIKLFYVKKKDGWKLVYYED